MTTTFPLALHITFGTYGTRLHGDPRGTVTRTQNQPGDPIIGHDPQWQRFELKRLRFPPVRLTEDQRQFIEEILPEICRRGRWRFHTAAAQLDHVHLLVSAPAEGKVVRRILKRWLGQELSLRWPRPAPDATWWAEGGSVKWIWNEAYFERAFEYIQRQRATSTPPRKPQHRY